MKTSVFPSLVQTHSEYLNSVAIFSVTPCYCCVALGVILTLILHRGSPQTHPVRVPWQWGWHRVPQGAAQPLPFPSCWHLCLGALVFSSKAFWPPGLGYGIHPPWSRSAAWIPIISFSTAPAGWTPCQCSNTPSSFPVRESLFGEGTRPCSAQRWMTQVPGVSLSITIDLGRSERQKAEWPWFLSPTHWEYSWIWNSQPLMTESWIPTKNLLKKKKKKTP